MNARTNTDQKQKSTFNSPYWFGVVLLAVIILMTATATVKQAQERHQTYDKIMQLQKEFRKMHTEEQRLLIEQQTFSSTPVVASRAVKDLQMFYPDDSHRKVIAPPNFAPQINQPTSKKTP